MRNDEVRAAAERLIRDLPTLEEGGMSNIAGDVATVARAALEARQEVARLTEHLRIADEALGQIVHQDDDCMVAACHARSPSAIAYEARLTLSGDDARAALPTPGEPESSGGGE